MPRLLLTTLLTMTTAMAIAQYNPNARPGYGINMQPAEQQEMADSTEKRGFDPNKLVFGGNFSISFGDFSFINISPQVGYMFSPMFTAGAGINYINSGIKYYDGNGNEAYREKYGYAGMSLFARFFPTNFAFLMAQPEMNYSWGKVKFNSDQPDINLQSAWVPTFLIGAGANLGGQRGRGLLLSVQYDLAQDPRSPYGTQAFISMGYAF